MDRRVVFMVGMVTLMVGVPMASAGGITTASAFLQQFALEAQSYLYGAAAVLFLGALIAMGASGFMHITSLLGVPIYYAILASIGAGVIAVFLGGVGLTPGADAEFLSTPATAMFQFDPLALVTIGMRSWRHARVE